MLILITREDCPNCHRMKQDLLEEGREFLEVDATSANSMGDILVQILAEWSFCGMDLEDIEFPIRMTNASDLPKDYEGAECEDGVCNLRGNRSGSKGDTHGE